MITTYRLNLIIRHKKAAATEQCSGSTIERKALKQSLVTDVQGQLVYEKPGSTPHNL